MKSDDFEFMCSLGVFESYVLFDGVLAKVFVVTIAAHELVNLQMQGVVPDQRFFVGEAVIGPAARCVQ